MTVSELIEELGRYQADNVIIGLPNTTPDGRHVIDEPDIRIVEAVGCPEMTHILIIIPKERNP